MGKTVRFAEVLTHTKTFIKESVLPLFPLTPSASLPAKPALVEKPSSASEGLSIAILHRAEKFLKTVKGRKSEELSVFPKLSRATIEEITLSREGEKYQATWFLANSSVPFRCLFTSQRIEDFSKLPTEKTAPLSQPEKKQKPKP